MKDISSLDNKNIPGNGISVLSMPEYAGLQFLQDVGRFLDNPDWFITEHLLKVKFPRKMIEQYRERYRGENPIMISSVTSTSPSSQ